MQVMCQGWLIRATVMDCPRGTVTSVFSPQLLSGPQENLPCPRHYVTNNVTCKRKPISSSFPHILLSNR